MKKEIEQWKKENGNSSQFTIKDMQMYTLHKLDKIEEKLNKNEIGHEKRYATKKMVMSLATFGFVLLSALASYVVYG